MIGNLMPKGTWRFPEIGFAAQPITSALELLRTHRRYAPLAAAVGFAVVAVGFAAAGYVQHLRNVADAQIAASHIEAANIDLQDQLARLRDQIAASNRDLAAAQSRVVALTEEVHAHAQAAPPPASDAAQPAGKGGDKTAQLSQALHVAEAQRATLAARLSKAEADLAEQQAKQADLLGQVEQWQKKLEQLSSDRDRLKARVGELEKQSALRHAQQQQAVAAAQPAPVAPTAVAAAPAATATAAPQPEAEASQRVAGILNAPQPAVAPAPAPAVPPAPVAPSANPVSAASAAAVAVGHSAVDQFARVLASAGDRKSTRLNSSHLTQSRMPSSA